MKEKPIKEVTPVQAQTHQDFHFDILDISGCLLRIYGQTETEVIKKIREVCEDRRN